ncbi:MAG: alpha/beta fold hydrolase [Chloroflexota bacterium]|nr:MAG: alpha/beta fold hydrolase [Chloroflexota bacterium]
MKPAPAHTLVKEAPLVNPHLEGGPFFWEAGPVGVLLTHGYTATSSEVRPLAEALHARGYTVAAPLLPGHGTQPSDANQYRWQDWALEVEKVYRQLAGRCFRVAVGGESTGGVLSLYLASQHPEIAAVLCYAPALRLLLSPLKIAQLYLVSPFIPYTTKKPGEMNSYWQGYPVFPLKGAIELLRLQGVVRRRLADISQPVFIAQGRLDPTVSARAPVEIYEGVRSQHKELHWLDHSAHCVLIDRDMDQVTAHTFRFLDRVLPVNETVHD